MKKDEHATPEEREAFKLHAKDVRSTRKTLKERSKIIRELDATLADLFDAAAMKFEKHTPGETDAVDEDGDDEMTAADIVILKAQQLLKELPPGVHAIINVRTFTVTERKKARRRWITHTPHFNKDHEDFVDAAGVPLPKPTTCMRKVARFAHARCYDFAWFFGQFAIESDKFVIRLGKKKYALTTIPTGSNVCPMLAQLYSMAIANATIRLAKIAGFSDIDSDTYVDNIRFLAQSEVALNCIDSIFRKICAIAAVTVNEDDDATTSTTKYTFLGALYDHEKKTTCIAQKTFEKLVEINMALQTQSQRFSMRDMLRIFGILQYAATVSGTNRALYYTLYKFMRRRAAAAWALDDDAEVWPCTRHLWLDWVARELKRHQQQWFIEAPLHGDLYTDACGTGLGAIIFWNDGSTSVLARPLVDHELRAHINVKEAMAVDFALSSIVPPQEHFTLSLFVDNTSVLYTAEKGRSRSFELNLWILRIGQLAISKRIICYTYVNTSVNPADYWSRIFTPRSSN